MEPPTHTAPPVVSTALFIPLRREWFEAFRKGHKTFEYRPYGARWNEKTCRIGRKVTLSLAYGKQNRMHGEVVSFEKSEDVTRTEAWKSCYEGKGHTHAAKIGIRILGMNTDSAPVVKQFVECPSCGKIWPYNGHAADVCCGGCSHNFYVPPNAMLRRLHECESVLRSVVKNVPIMVAGFRGTLLHSNCVRLVGEQNAAHVAQKPAASNSDS